MEGSIHLDSLSTDPPTEMSHNHNQSNSSMETTGTLTNIISEGVAAARGLVQRDHHQSTSSSSQDGLSASAPLERPEGFVEKPPQARIQAHIQAQIAASTSDGDSNSVQTYFSARSASVNPKPRRIHNSASEGILGTRYQAEAVEQLEDRRRASDEVDRKGRKIIEMPPNGSSTLRAPLHQTPNPDDRSPLPDSDDTQPRAPVITVDDSAANGQVAAKAPAEAPADSEVIEHSSSSRIDQPPENDDGSTLRHDTTTRGGGAFSTFRAIPGRLRRPKRSPRLSELEAPGHSSPSPETSARRRFARFAKNKERNSGDHPSSANRPPSDESLDTARKRFLRRFRNDSGSRQRRRKFLWRAFTVRNQLQSTLFKSWVDSWANTLLFLIPIGLTLYCISARPIAVLITNLISIIPLTGLLSLAVEEVSLRLGETFGIILNAVFGNATDIVIVMLALADDNAPIFRLYLIGSIVGNLLLCTGASFFFGGLRRTEQFFNMTFIGYSSDTLLRATGSLLLPAIASTSSEIKGSSPSLSRIAAVILLVLYFWYIFHKAKIQSQVALFSTESKKVPKRPLKRRGEDDEFENLKRRADEKTEDIEGDTSDRGRKRNLSRRAPMDEMINITAYDDEDDEEFIEPQLHIYVALFTMAASVTLIIFCSKFMTSQVRTITEPSPISIEFLGLVILPLVPNLVDFAKAIIVASNDKLDLALAIPFERSIDSILLTFPIVVIVGWIMGNESMTLDLGLFPASVLILAVFMLWSVVLSGKSTSWTGVQMIGAWALFATSSWFYKST